MNISGEKTIYKDDRGLYKVFQKGSKLNEETKQYEDDWQKISVDFQPKVDLKNKTKINVKDGYDSHYVIKTQWTYDDGKPAYMKMPKYIIKDFEVIEDGIDEVMSSKPKKTVESNFSDDTFGGYYPDTYSEDTLPF